MRIEKLQRKLPLSELGIHQRRVEAFWRVVIALVCGGKLWLTELGRARSEPGHEKHGIKAVDRLLGNVALHRARFKIYGAVAKWICRGKKQMVVLVDISEIRPGICELSASVAMMGRSVRLYALVRRKRTISTVRTQKIFLKDLAKVLPNHVTPILVTDAGFQSPWFDAVKRMGWNFVGRVRHKTQFLRDEKWVDAQDLHALAKKSARNLGMISFPKCHPQERRIVLSKARIAKGRRRINHHGRKGKTANDRRCQKSEREPWLLATSLTCAPRDVVAIYEMRMQIEQNYRDTKNHRWGWQLSLSGSKSNARLEMLLLIATVAMLAVFAAGAIAEHFGHHHRYQANTVRHKRVLSWFFLGSRMFKQSDAFLTETKFELGLRLIRQHFQCLELIV